jgi:hypothetical protein
VHGQGVEAALPQGSSRRPGSAGPCKAKQPAKHPAAHPPGRRSPAGCGPAAASCVLAIPLVCSASNSVALQPCAGSLPAPLNPPQSPPYRHWLYLEYGVPVKATLVQIMETKNLRFVYRVALVGGGAARRPDLALPCAGQVQGGGAWEAAVTWILIQAGRPRQDTCAPVQVPAWHPWDGASQPGGCRRKPAWPKGIMSAASGAGLRAAGGRPQHAIAAAAAAAAAGWDGRAAARGVAGGR